MKAPGFLRGRPVRALLMMTVASICNSGIFAESAFANDGATGVQFSVCVLQDSHQERIGLAFSPDGRFMEARTTQTPSGDVETDLVGTNKFNGQHEYVQVLGGIYVGALLMNKPTTIRFWSYEKIGPDMLKLTGIKAVDRVTGKVTDMSRNNSWICKHNPAGDATAEQMFRTLPRGAFY
ncbi:hypothetical protein PQQ88_01770 [Paraburkholderia caledonica]|uniref:hypothetical protein n=1 Tax=Paraburkholderia caledonica TaxID=134536 RepID=UPI0038BB20B1